MKDELIRSYVSKDREFTVVAQIEYASGRSYPPVNNQVSIIH